ncbi:hypothetical protein BEL04_01420 [Mucilaginibacter sp. PPCGB 2223]|uniref:carbamoyltransferase family protein n=1 Tax=Mucilaginibacter sp. PPCGB 2223 TaxID=1886027 RepID=UPI00082402EF|nr:carbamoyltransferase [Mucilaginibacter sp. PPCGB 2223]OCX53004.1 hypothetical protein BEL04_01420 [Mucilaginibacter sp. PPCGB 2223]
MYVLGLSGYYHDSAACLIKDGAILAAAQEERFTRIKNDAAFPQKSIEYCLAYAGIRLSDVDHIVFYEKPFLKFERLLETFLSSAPYGIRPFLKAMPIWLKEKLYFKKMLVNALRRIDQEWRPGEGQLLFCKHHQSHAASAFYASPFSSAVILTVDGVGEWETTSVSIGAGHHIQPDCYIAFPHSLGLLYSAFTYHLGFKVNCDEYKVMGLAPYGKPVYLDIIFDELVDMKSDGSFQLNMKYFNYTTGLTMTSKHFDVLINAARRHPDEPISQKHMDIAASIQTAAEQIMLKITTALYAKHRIENLCLAGGVALNCVVNSKILKLSGFKNIWVQPAAGDAGGALGAALAVYHQYLDNKRLNTSQDRMQNSLLGPECTTNQVLQALNASGLAYEKYEKRQLYSTIASEIAGGKVVGYFNGRMEFGPRALGARSILADARNPEMQSLLNQKIKFRESFRPFAPAVLEEFADDYFDLGVKSPYMLMVGDVRSDKRIADQQQGETNVPSIKRARSVIPAVTHVDYSARLQTVNATDHPDFYQLIRTFFELTGCPMLINTSFNRMDEPIVCTPQDALDCFLGTGIDILVISEFLVRKSAI